MKLAAKLMMIFLLAALPLMTLSSYLTVQREMRQLAKSQERKVRSFANEIQGLLVSSHQKGGLEGLVSSLRSYATPLQPLRIRWVWFEGPNGNGLSPSVPMSRIESQVLAGQLVSVANQVGGQGFLHTYFPLTMETRAGGIEVTGSLAEFERSRKATIYNTLLTVGGMALVCALIVIGAGVQLVGKPLNRLIKRTEAIGRGVKCEPLHLPGSDELSELAKSINDMSTRLQVQQEEIQSETSKRMEALKQLRHADRLKTVGRLAAGIAHEIGTPLNVISGRAAMIGSGQLDEDAVVRGAKTIKQEAERITGIIRQLLDFARQNQPQRADTDLRTLVEHTIDLLQSIATKANVTVKLEADATCDYSTCVDQGQIQQVLTNVIVNAIQSIDAPNGLVTVNLSRTIKGDGDEAKETIHITIEDNGCGISDDNLDNLFEPFFTTKDVGEGTGLGLSIAFGMIEEHGGWIDVSSKVGQGSHFEVYLPVGEVV